MPQSPGRPHLLVLLTFLLPLAASWSVGFFLCTVQATVVPYRNFLLLGCLAGQLQFTPPPIIQIASAVFLIISWLVWGWLVHRRTKIGLVQSLSRGALSYLPLLLLPCIAFVAHPGATQPQPLLCLAEPLLLVSVGAVFAMKAWLWTGAGSRTGATDLESSNRRVWLMFFGSAVVFATLGVLQFLSWNVPHLDTGSSEEFLWKTMHGQFLRADVFEDMFLGYHVYLTHLLLLPVYALWPSTEWLTILQAFAVASGVFPMWWLARRHWEARHALWFPLLYLLQPALHFANAEVNYNTYRPEAFLIPLFLFGIYFLENKRWVPASVFGLLILLLRHDMAIAIAAIGPYLAWTQKRWVVGTALLALGIGYWFLATEVIIPHFSHERAFPRLGMFAGLGTTSTEIALNLLRHPTIVWGRMLQPANVVYVTVLLLPLGLLCLGKPSLTLVGTPALAAGMLTTEGVQNSIYYHYHLIPFVFFLAAAPGGAAELASIVARRFRCPLARAQSLLFAFALGTAGLSTLLGAKTPFCLNFYYPHSNPFHYSALYQRSAHTELLERMKTRIPLESAVTATPFAASHFTHHRRCYTFPERWQDADYILADLNARWTKGARAEMQRWGEAGPPGFELTWVEDGVFLFKRRATEAPTPATSKL